MLLVTGAKRVQDIAIKVTDFARGHPQGAQDRAIRQVDLMRDGVVVATHRYSKNWNPRGFGVYEALGHSFDYLLQYSCAGEQRGILANFN